MINGLTKEEVKKRCKEGQVNGNFAVKTKSIGQIIFTNVFTLFNAVNLFLAVSLILVHSYKNIMFLGVVFWNCIIGIVQEVRSKRVIDKLSLLSAPHVNVIRDGDCREIPLEDIVIDDVIMLKNGNQVCVDSVIIQGECEVNESLLTGESDPIYKKKGDEILSGSYLISGNVITKAVRVGKENYVNKITSQAKYLKRPNSEIMKTIKTIIKCVSIVIFPVAGLLLLNQLSEQSFSEAVVGAVAGVIGMIPSGLVLLTSMVLAVSVVRLGMKNTLVQELYCIETLARVDVLCLDKTGTITQGKMSVNDVIPINKEKDEVLEKLSLFVSNLEDDNQTFRAIKSYVKELKLTAENKIDIDRVICQVPFSSEKKYSMVDFEESGCVVLGAAEFIFKEIDKDIKKMADEYADKGMRVLFLAASKNHSENKELPSGLEAIGIIAVGDKIRKEAPETFKYFTNQGVKILVISGDNPRTVSRVACEAGVIDADNYIDATELKSDEELYEAASKYTVFGRVTPHQKLELVKALKKQGHTVAMTGDGVNDVMALKESDCSIAMQSGSDAARNVSQLVLLDSNFASLPMVVAEGRRTINNLQRSASLYLTKTIYSVILAIMFVILPLAYPFIPIQFTFIGSITIGMPSFILALEPNVNRIKGSFFINILKLAIPGAMLVITNISMCIVFKYMFKLTGREFTTVCVYGLAIASLLQLVKCCKPFNYLRQVMCCVIVGLFILGTIFGRDILGITHLTFIQTLFCIGMMFTSCILYITYSVLVGRIMGSEPNVYRVNVYYKERRNYILVEDEVDKKDYFDVAAQMRGLKAMRAEAVAFVKKPENGGDIRIEMAEGERDEELILAAARQFYLKDRKKNMKEVFLVETNKGTQSIESAKIKEIRHIKRIKLTF